MSSYADIIESVEDLKFFNIGSNNLPEINTEEEIVLARQILSAVAAQLDENAVRKLSAGDDNVAYAIASCANLVWNTRENLELRDDNVKDSEVVF